MPISRQRAYQPFEARRGCVGVLAWQYADGHHINSHQHRSHQLVYATSGVMTVYVARGTFVVPPTRAVWVPGGLDHAIDIAGAVAMRALYIDPGLWPRAPRNCRVIEVTPLLSALIGCAVERAGLDRRRVRDARLIAVLRDELSRGLPPALRITSPVEPRAARVASRAMADPGARLSLKTLARGTGASARTIERLYQTELGLSFGQWRRQLRLMRALQRLAAGDKVTTTAVDAGYTSVSAFIAAFRRLFGVTPGQYFRLHRAH